MTQITCPQCAHISSEEHKFCAVCGFPIGELVSQQDDPVIGKTLNGGFQILELVGVGGMGRVYRAEQKMLGRTVAVKVIHPHLSGDESASARFITEARAISRLNHPNSVSIIDFGKKDGQLYIVMEFLRGRDLARVAYEDGPLPFPRIIDVLVQVLAALAEAHHLGIIHRDLKPENVVLQPLRTGGDFVKVVDFGLAKIKEANAGPGITMPGIVCGTPDYMAPEQGRGDPLDGRIDLYACGVILYQLLTGRLPYEAESPTRVVLMHMTMPLPNPAHVAPERNIPPVLIEVTRKALEKEASNRYQTAAEFADGLRRALSVIRGDGAIPPPPASERGVACPNCGAQIARQQKFCGECGTRVSILPPVARNSSRTGANAASGSRYTSVRSPSAARTNRSPSPVTLPLPFAGREADMAWLESARQSLDAGPPVIRLIGEPGYGKSRLLREFAKSAAKKGDFVIELDPDPWRAGVGYYALRRALSKLAGLPESGGSADEWIGASPEAKQGLADVFAKGEVKVSPPLPVWSKPASGTPIGEDRRQMAASALRWALLRAQQREPGRRILIIVDDLHELDGSSRSALANLAFDPPDVPFLMIAAHSSDFVCEWQGEYLELPGLAPEMAQSLAKTAVPFISEHGDDDLNVPPLFVEHLIRFTTEGGSEPPNGTADLVALRVERLSQEARRTLQAIAVIGDAADKSELSTLVPDIKNLDDVLKRLLDGGFIEEYPASDEGPGKGRPTAHRLKPAHPLIREVTLAMMPAAVRRQLHEKAPFDAQGDPLPLPLEARALHAFYAQSSFEALMLLEQVADRARSRGDQEGCISALRRGLELSRLELVRGELDDPERAAFIFSRKLGEALALSGQFQDAEGILREALDWAEPSGRERAMVLGTLAFVAYQRGRTHEASTFLQEALAIARQSNIPELLSSLERMRRDWLRRPGGPAGNLVAADKDN